MNIEPLLPAYNENNIPIVLQSSNYFAPYAAVTIKSIIDHASADKNYDIIVTSIDMRKETLDKLSEMAYEYPNISVRGVNVSKYHKTYCPRGNARVGSESSTRIFLSEVLEEYPKVLNVDSDMLLTSDIAAAFDVDVSDAYIAAAPDVLMCFFYYTNAENGAFRALVHDVIGLDDVRDYFNCGFMVMNLDRIRKEVFPDEIIAFDKEGGCRFAEQDPLNHFYKDMTVRLGMNWNYCVDPTHVIDFSEQDVPDELVSEYCEAKGKPDIIHFVTWKKPWQYDGVEYSELFWKVAESTPFYDEILRRYKEFRRTHREKVNEERAIDKKAYRISEQQMKKRLAKINAERLGN